MIRLVFGDLHLSPVPRDRYRLDFALNQIPKLDEQHKPDQLIFLGDLCHEKDKHPASLVNEVVGLFARLAKKVDIIILQGNHDFSHVSHPYFRFLENIQGITWISKPAVIDGCLFLPHTRNHERDLDGIDLRGHDFIFAHNIFTGADVSGRQLSGIPTSIFPKEAVVISGDVHKPQTFGPVTYVGAPYTTDFGDDYDPRVLLLTDRDFQSVPVGGPQKRLINASVELVNGKRELIFGYHILNVNPGDLVKIRVALPMQFKAEWASIRQEVQDRASDLVVCSIVPVVEIDPGEKPEQTKSYKKTDQEYFQAYVERVGLDPKTAEVGKSLMED